MKINILTSMCFFLVFTSAQSMSKQYPSFSYSGSIKIDYDSFDEQFLEDQSKSEDNLELRRLRFSIDTDFTSDWSAKFKFDAEDSFDIKDAFIKFDGWDVADITLGKQKEPFGLERLMSTKNLPSIERSMMSKANSSDRSLGINISGNRTTVNWRLGYFQDDNAEKSNAITGRLAWAPWRSNKNLVHLGAAFSERSLHGDLFRINEQLEVNSADSLIEGSKIIADSMSQKGLEFIWQYKGFVNMAEWQKSTVTATDGGDYVYAGGYYQLSYLFSGKNRKYKNGILGSVKAKNDWEVTMRYSQLKLHEENSEANVVLVGLNYIFDKDLKLMANYLNADYVDEGVDLGSGNAVSLRMLYRF